MYKRQKMAKSQIGRTEVIEGETIETKEERIVENKEPITDGKTQANIDADTGLKGAQKAQAIAQEKLTKALENKTHQEATGIINKVAQDWQRLAQENKGLDRQEQEKNIKAYEAKIKAEYPSIWEMIGSGAREFIGVYDSFTGRERTGYKDPTK